MPPKNRRNQRPVRQRGLTNQPTVSNVPMKAQQALRSSRMRGKVRYAEAINSKVALRVDIFGFYNTRLYQQFLLWEKWHVNSITFQFVPTLSKTAPGTIAMAPDYDPEDVHRPEMANIMDSMNSKASAICETFQVVMPNFKQPDGVTVIPSLFTDWRGPPRTTTYGLLKYVVSGTGLAANASVGYIDLVYDITFLIPQKEPDDQIYPDTTDRKSVV